MYQVFLSVLQISGYAAIPNGDVVKIVPDANAKTLALPFAGQPGESADSMVVSVVPANHVGVAALVPVLRNLVSQQGHLAAYAPSNVVIVADRAENVARITEIIQRIDREESDGAEIITLENATASEVASSLNSIVTANRGASGGTTPVALAADDRSNTIIVSGDRGQRMKMRALIAQLDIPAELGGNTEVIYLRYQRAEDLVPVLSNVLTSYFSSSANSTNSPMASPTSSRISSGTSQRQTQQSQQQQGSTGSSYGQEFSGFQNAERQATGTVIGPYGVQAEPNMNALIITAPPSLMRNLRAVIKELDVRRAQVLVEAVIAEVAADRNTEFGIEWRGGGAMVGGQVWQQNGGPGFLDQLQGNIDSPNPEDNLQIPGSGLTVGIIKNGSIRFLLHALTVDSSSNVLSTPSVLAMDNAEAVISVAEAIPFKIGEYATTGDSNTVEPFNTFEYREVGLQLVIKPQISQGDTIQLDIMQRADSILSDTTDQPTTKNRMITTRVMVSNKDILVLGGLIQNQEIETVSKVPFLGDIPIIGKAFQSSYTSTQKTNLMIFIRPSIVRDFSDAEELTNIKYNFIRDQQILSAEDETPEMREALFLPWEGTSPEALPLPQPFD